MDRKKIGEFWKRQGIVLLRGFLNCLPLCVLLAAVLLLTPVWKNWLQEEGISAAEERAVPSEEGIAHASSLSDGEGLRSDAVQETASGDGAFSLGLEKTATGEIVSVELNEYLTGVLLAEVSPDFPAAALEAQAIAARTYCLYRMEKGLDHPSGADLCDAYSHCMAYVDPANADEKSVTAMRKAVEATDGLVLLYDGALIDAVFHDSSPYYTESALAVWGVDLPYLQPAATPEEVSEKTLTFTAEELFQKMGKSLSADAPPSAAPFGGVTKDPSGRAESVIVYGVSFPATELRLALGLPSTSFTVTYEDALFTFHVYGWGHGVGMSQKGAAAFAKGGSSATDILLHYYAGCTVSNYFAAEK